MFDFAWSEIALIGVVALVAIGPKDMPVAVKSVAALVKKARRMAGEFQTHLDDLMKEADLGEMRAHLSDLRSFNLRDTVERTIDADGSLRTTLSGVSSPTSPPSPGAPQPPLPLPSPADPDPVETFVGVRPTPTLDPMHAPPATPLHTSIPPPDHLRPALNGVPPAFIPPHAVAAERALHAAPAFIPPASARIPAANPPN